MSTHKPVNNQCWALAIIVSYYRLGVRNFCVAPGSRSAPLATAVFQFQQLQKNIAIYTHFDERGLGFFALNLAKASCEPVVVIMTSGTAVANLTPPVIEAYETSVSLIILSADRPDRLLNCGANQAIQQKNLFSSNVVWQCNLVLPTSEDKLQQQIALLANNLPVEPCLGPAHINCQFDDPLYTHELKKETIQYVINNVDHSLKHAYVGNAKCMNESRVLELTALTGIRGRSLIVLGAVSLQQYRLLKPWLNAQSCGIVCDIASQNRFGSRVNTLTHFDLMLLRSDVYENLQFDYILQFGGRIVSKRINTFLEKIDSNYHIFIENNKNLDPTGKAITHIVSYDMFAAKFSRLKLVDDKLKYLVSVNTRISTIVNRWVDEQWSEIFACCQLVRALPSKAKIFCGNSLAIRLMDSFAQHNRGDIQVYANRGASGIDGLIASAAGVAASGDDPCFLIIGDISFLHDLNSLAMLSQVKKPVKILLLNNNGGSIFKLLPAAKEPSYSSLFQMPHGYSFECAAKQFNLEYQHACGSAEMLEGLNKFVQCHSSMILECAFTNNDAIDHSGSIHRKIMSFEE